jgi:hypothetical protein
LAVAHAPVYLEIRIRSIAHIDRHRTTNVRNLLRYNASYDWNIIKNVMSKYCVVPVDTKLRNVVAKCLLQQGNAIAKRVRGILETRLIKVLPAHWILK